MRSRILVAALLVAGSAAAQDPPPLGELVDIGGYRMHLYCTGKGDQTVVLSPGSGDFSFDWHLVQQSLSASARVCSYDRAGTGWSDTGPQPATMRQEAHDVRAALQRAKERGPFILVGQSLGGLVVRVFAQQYPRDTAGVVLVDATSPDTTLMMQGKVVRLREIATNRPVPEVQTMKSSPPRLLNEQERERARAERLTREISAPYDRLPADIQRLQLWAWSRPPRFEQGDTYLAEELRDMHQLAKAGTPPMGNKPLVTIIGMSYGAAPPEVPREEWERLMQEKIAQKRAFAELSTNSKIVEAKNSGHHVHLEEPQTVVKAVLDVLRAARHRAPLPQ